MSSSSSSEEDDSLKKLQEAVSEELITHMERKTAEDISTDNDVPIKNLKLSKRSKDSSDETNFDLISTPEFKAHVAKKLASLLDRSIKDINVKSKPRKVTSLHGIRLLKSSNSEINDSTENNRTTRRETLIVSSSSDSDEERKLAMVCVSGTSILNNGEGVFAKNSTEEITFESNNKDIAQIIVNKRKRKLKSMKKNEENQILYSCKTFNL